MAAKTCPVCKGKGWVPDGDDPAKCHGCDGKGTVSIEEALHDDADDPRDLEE